MRHHVTATGVVRTRIQVHGEARSVHVGVADSKNILEVFIDESAHSVLVDDVRIVCSEELVGGIIPLLDRVVTDSEAIVVMREDVEDSRFVGVWVLIDGVDDYIIVHSMSDLTNLFGRIKIA